MKKSKTAKKPSAKKPAREPSARPSRKAGSRVHAVKRPASARPPAKGPNTTPPKAPAVKPPPPTPPSKPSKMPTPPDAPARKTPYTKRELDQFRKLLLDIRDRVVDGISFLAGENLRNSQRDATGDLSNYGMHMADQGTDNFEHEFALSMVSNEQDMLYEIDEAMRRIDARTYGVCEMTGRLIERQRLRVLPYARFCREAQETLERGRKKFRPFGPSMTQTSES